VRRKAEALVATGFVVDVLALRAPGGRKDYTVGGVNIRTIALGKRRGSLSRYLFEYATFFLWVFTQIASMTRHRRYAVVDVNTLPDFLVFAPIVARWMGAKIILDMHEITPEFYMSKYGIREDSWLVRGLLAVERMSFNFADHVLTITDPILDLLVNRGLPRSKSTVVMNAVDEKHFDVSSVPVPDDTPAQRPDRFIMMYHGTLTPLYGLDLAIEALGLVRDDMPGAELWILGSGSEYSVLERLAKTRGVESKVRLMGQVPSKDIPAWLERCDVGLLPIRSDVFLEFAFPNKLPEFIIAGKPVIVSRLKTINHYFSENALTFFKPNDPADLARQMMCLYRDRQIGVRRVIRAKEEYAPIRWEVMKNRYLEVVANMVETASRHRTSKTVST
jgi:glycosyltransferase involved in cell wall biosynthesis